jgi:hypothetical protein
MSNHRDIDELLGVDWSNVGKQTLGGLHTLGKVTLQAFGAGAVAAPLDAIEAKSGALPTWSTASISVEKPDYVVLVKSNEKPLVVKAPSKAVVFAGARLEGNGYKSGDPFGTTFSFGVDGPSRVEVTTSGKTQSHTDVKQVLFLGGKEGSDTVLGGLDMDDETLAELDTVFGDSKSALESLSEATAPSASPGADFSAYQPSLTAQMQHATPTTTYQAALARALAAKTRQANAAAQQPFLVTLPTLTPVTVPSLNIAPDGSLNMSNAPTPDTVLGEDEELDTVLGDAMSSYEIVGDDMNSVEIVGERKSTIKETTVPRGPVPKKKEEAGSTITIHGLDEVLGELESVCGDDMNSVEIIGGRDDSAWTEIVGEDEAEGGSDYVLGSDVIGANPAALTTRSPASRTAPLASQAKKKAVPTRTAPSIRGKRPVKMAGRSTNKSPHKLALTRTLNVANRALRAGKQAQARAASTTTVRGDEVLGMTNAQRARLKKYMASLEKTILSGDEVLGDSAFAYEVLGAVTPAAPRQLTPVQQAAVAKRTKAQARTAAAKQKAKQKGELALTAANKAAASVKKAKPLIDKLLAKAAGPTRVRGDEGDAEDVINIADGASEVFGAQTDPDPLNPGFLIDGSPDSSGGYKDPYANPTAGAGNPSDYSDGGDIPLPVRGQPLSKEEAEVVYQNVPADGVIYQGDKGYPSKSLGSWNFFYNGEGAKYPDGYFFTDDYNWNEQDAPKGPIFAHRDKLGVIRKDFPWQEHNETYLTDKHVIDLWPTSWVSSVKEAAADSVARGWGPLIGNPAGPLAGLQFAIQDNVWFWQSDKAPVWATKVADDQIALLNKQAREAANAAAAADQARVEQENAQMAEAQAAQDASIALAQQQADAQAAITQGQIDQQLQVADAQAAAQYTALDLQQASLEQSAAKADLEYAIAHPAETAELQAQEEQDSDGMSEGDGTDRDTDINAYDRSFSSSMSDLDPDAQSEDEAMAASMDQEA